MYTEKLFQDLNPEQRLEALRTNAYKEDKENVKRAFSEDEVRTLNDDIAYKSVLIDTKKIELKDLTTPLKSEIKTLEGDNRQLINMARVGYRQEEEPVFQYDDQENGQMHVYDQEGTLLYTRKLFPAERQTIIKPIQSKQA